MDVSKLDNAHLVIWRAVTTRDHRGIYALFYSRKMRKCASDSVPIAFADSLLFLNSCSEPEPWEILGTRLRHYRVPNMVPEAS